MFGPRFTDSFLGPLYLSQALSWLIQLFGGFSRALFIVIPQVRFESFSHSGKNIVQLVKFKSSHHLSRYITYHAFGQWWRHHVFESSKLMRHARSRSRREEEVCWEEEIASGSAEIKQGLEKRDDVRPVVRKGIIEWTSCSWSGKKGKKTGCRKWIKDCIFRVISSRVKFRQKTRSKQRLNTCNCTSILTAITAGRLYVPLTSKYVYILLPQPVRYVT